MHEAHSYFVLAGHFLRLAEAAARRLVETGNTLTVVAGSEISPEMYARKTRWSDHSVGVAVMFSFYHGVELILKGCLLLDGTSNQSHRLSTLLKKFEEKHAGSELAAVLVPYI